MVTFPEPLLIVWQRDADVGVQSRVCSEVVYLPADSCRASLALSYSFTTQQNAYILLLSLPSRTVLCSL